MIFHIQNIKDIFDTFKTDINGLSKNEAERRIITHGKNTLPKNNTFIKIILQF